jgi:hypothetical protein
MTLEPGDPRRVRIGAREPWNDTGLIIVAGQRYEMRSTGTWTDFFITRDAEGFTSDEAPALTRRLLKKHEHRRRQPRENWFTLIGAIGREETTAFRIGTALTFRADRTGELSCFANDVPDAYWNNWGSVELVVTRLP